MALVLVFEKDVLMLFVCLLCKLVEVFPRQIYMMKLEMCGICIV